MHAHKGRISPCRWQAESEQTEERRVLRKLCEGLIIYDVLCCIQPPFLAMMGVPAPMRQRWALMYTQASGEQINYLAITDGQAHNVQLASPHKHLALCAEAPAHCFSI